MSTRPHLEKPRAGRWTYRLALRLYANSTSNAPFSTGIPGTA